MDDVLQRERARQLGPVTNVDDELSDETGADNPEPSLAPADESRTLSFAELKALIEEGKTDEIPNNRQIPNELNVGSMRPR